MNTYKITFTRENGTVGSDNFTAPSEAQARRDFKEVYRHGNGTITSVELVSSDAPATKQQERAALEKIRKIVEELGPDSYIATAFDGCFKDAEANIENDWALSMKDRWLTSDRELNDANGTIEELRGQARGERKGLRGSSRHSAPNRGGEGRRNSIPQEPPPRRRRPCRHLPPPLKNSCRPRKRGKRRSRPHRRGGRPAGKCGI